MRQYMRYINYTSFITSIICNNYYIALLYTLDYIIILSLYYFYVVYDELLLYPKRIPWMCADILGIAFIIQLEQIRMVTHV